MLHPAASLSCALACKLALLECQQIILLVCPVPFATGVCGGPRCQTQRDRDSASHTNQDDVQCPLISRSEKWWKPYQAGMGSFERVLNIKVNVPCKPKCFFLSHSQHCNASFPILPPAATAPPPPAMASRGQKPSLPQVLHKLEHMCDGIWPPLLFVQHLLTWPPHSLRLSIVLPDVGDTSMKDMLTELAC
eukprot:1153408-Pelagomonas_calceolata.AAC.3